MSSQQVPSLSSPRHPDFLRIPSVEKMRLRDGFRFGVEAEFLVYRLSDGQPLWHRELTFTELNSIFETISLDGIPALDGLDLEPPQTKLMPYVVEGYHLPDMDDAARSILPKGVEIRTPVCRSLPECLDVFEVLLDRLEVAMANAGYGLAALSHHPLESKFSGPQNKRRHDYWQWSMEVMTTYGPDINVSLPPNLAPLIDEADLEAKINYYGPALSALSVASPFMDGGPWKMRGQFGKSFRMYKRSYIAPPIEFHPDEKNRLEFKVFDMPASTDEFEAQFLSFLALVLNPALKGRASKQTRIYDLGQVARFGLQAESMSERAEDLLRHADAILEDWGFDPAPLSIFNDRLKTGVTPADEMLRAYADHGSLTTLLTTERRFRRSRQERVVQNDSGLHVPAEPPNSLNMHK